MTETLAQLMPYAIVVAAASVPVISVRVIAARYLNAARDVWLYALGWIAAALTFGVSVPLGLMACAVMLRWRSWEHLPTVATWAGIIATWAVVQRLEANVLAWLPIGWRVVTAALLVMACVQRWNGYEVKATTGSRVLLAALLALVWPFTHPAEWGLYAVGFWLTSSWIALAALLVAIAVQYPSTAPVIAGLAGLLVLLFAIPWTRVQLIDRTPRGGSLDGLRMRWRTWSAMLRVTRRWPRWIIGWGPSPADRQGQCLERELMRESVRRIPVPGRQDLAPSPTHCEPLELACTYGLLAVAAMVILAWQCVTRAALEDPWSASAAAGIVLSLATIPARAVPVGVVWLITLAVVVGR